MTMLPVVVPTNFPDYWSSVLTLPEVRSYVGEAASSKSDEQIQQALLAEQAAQAAVCRIEPYSYDLAEALLRRVACNLARRSIPLSVQSDGDGGGTYITSNDPEVRRLERPHRRVFVA